PSVLVRGTSTNPAGTLGAGYFGGGRNDRVADFSGRFDYDVQILWELQNLGFGNHARIKERQSESQLAMIELLRVQDRIAAEVVKAHAQARSGAVRLTEAEAGVKDALDSAKKHLDGMTQTQTIGKTQVLLIRPQEVQAAIQSLAQAYTDYY